MVGVTQCGFVSHFMLPPPFLVSLSRLVSTRVSFPLCISTGRVFIDVFFILMCVTMLPVFAFLH